MKPGNKKLLSILLLILLWFAAVIAAVLGAFPAFQDYSESLNELRAVESTLNERLQADIMPSVANIDVFDNTREHLISELQESSEFYLDLQDDLFSHDLLETASGDPYRVAGNFREFMAEIEAKAKSQGFLNLGAVDDWVGRTDGRPAPELFPLLEKKTAIAYILVEILNRHSVDAPININGITISDPEKMHELEHATIAGVSMPQCQVFPVQMKLDIRLDILKILLDDLSAINMSNPTPFLIINKINLNTDNERRQKGVVNVEIQMDLLDFYVQTDK